VISLVVTLLAGFRMNLTASLPWIVAPEKGSFLACGLVQTIICLEAIGVVNAPQKPIRSFTKPCTYSGTQKKQQRPQFPEDKTDIVLSAARFLHPRY
jgi:hypothetical protein